MACDIAFQAERAEAGNFFGLGVDAPHLADLVIAIRGFEQMLGKDCEAIEDSLAGAVRFGEIEFDGVVVDLFYDDGFVVDDEEVALRRVERFVEIQLEGEDDVVGCEGCAVGEFHVATRAVACICDRRAKLSTKRRARVRCAGFGD